MRSIAKLMQDWQFTGPDGKTTLVELPHTWNAKDGQDGGNDYWRGTCSYSTTFAAPAFDAASQEVWLQFEGVNSSAKVLLNGRNICTHDGIYRDVSLMVVPKDHIALGYFGDTGVKITPGHQGRQGRHPGRDPGRGRGRPLR